MCGILWTRGFKLNANESALKAIRHRGPDHSGYITTQRDFFGHVRLSILDLDERNNQPFADDQGNILIFNGEIYNYPELKSELEGLGHTRWETTGDTEVLFTIMKHRLFHLLHKLNGMWAFVFHAADGSVYASRDRYGIKPLFQYVKEDLIVLASEITAIQKLVQLNINTELVQNFILRPSSVNGRNSFFKEVKDVSPGILFEHEGGILKPLFTIKQTERTSSIKKAVERAIEVRLRCDVPVGVALSSGVDSNIIGNVIHDKNEGQRLNAFTVQSEGLDSQEADVAEEVCQAYKWDHHRVNVKADAFLKQLRNTVQKLNKPHSSFAIVSVDRMYEAVKGRDVKVLLEGQGADERFGGYRIQQIAQEVIESAYALRFYKAYRTLVLGKIGVKHVIRHGLGKSRLAFYLLYSVKMRSYLRFEWTVIKNILPSNHDLGKNLENLLFYSDHLSMSHGVEVRNPFMDDVFHNEQMKSRNGYTKVELRESFKDIDAYLGRDIIWNKEKLGFRTPIADMLTLNHEEVVRLYNSFQKRNLVALKPICKLPKKLDEEMARLIYRVISTELWLDKK
jgi:asparagine synthase (glutamine-hydrolysing)